ncbi:hypothetical protein Pint_26000 [Pistacia integerrima]|uniref:Uncharacterized protein n=1 Tax=Pistacia integerrima TaxID=434235 RepID=A0ACC0YHR9_9ROSI|nr:hypothetical protein Pint_26000 [Pistacia integerrima]
MDHFKALFQPAQSGANTYLSRTTLLLDWELQFLSLKPEMKYDSELKILESLKEINLGSNATGNRFLVTTGDKGYTLTGLCPTVISRCFSHAHKEQITASSLQVPSIWNLPNPRHSLTPGFKNIFKKIWAAAYHNSLSFKKTADHRLYRSIEGLSSRSVPFSRQENLEDYLSDMYIHALAKILHLPGHRTPSLPHDESYSAQRQIHGFSSSKAQNFLSKSTLLYPWMLQLARSHPKIVFEYLSLRKKKCPKSSYEGRSPESVCGCEFCEFSRRYAVPLGKLKVPCRSEEGVRYMITTAETGYTLKGLSSRIISRCFFETDQNQIKASGLEVPSLLDIPQEHLLKPLCNDILKELEADAASHPLPNVVHVYAWSNSTSNEVCATPLARSSDEANFSYNEASCSNNGVSSDTERERDYVKIGLSELELLLKSTRASLSDPEKGTSTHPENEGAEPLLNRTRLAEATLVVAAKLAPGLFTQGSGGSSSLHKAKILKQFATICNLIAFLCCFYGILVCGGRPRRAARIITVVGYTALGFCFVGMTGMTLSDDLNLWFTAATCTALLSILIFALDIFK